MAGSEKFSEQTKTTLILVLLNTLLFTCVAKGGEGIRENPLARLLRPDGRDEKEKEQLRLPNRVQWFWNIYSPIGCSCFGIFTP
jgi:hypothetical protein